MSNALISILKKIEDIIELMNGGSDTANSTLAGKFCYFSEQ